jgi:hypothetical protein
MADAEDELAQAAAELEATKYDGDAAQVDAGLARVTDELTGKTDVIPGTDHNLDAVKKLKEGQLTEDAAKVDESKNGGVATKGPLPFRALRKMENVLAHKMKFSAVEHTRESINNYLVEHHPGFRIWFLLTLLLNIGIAAVQ